MGLLAEEIRAFLVEKVSRSGGLLGSNLGVVELTLALHRVFDSPRDVLLFDTGHQAYVNKMLTGRLGDFDTLRQADGLSGYPSRAESAHDVIENSHTSTALSYADGLAKAFALAPADTAARKRRLGARRLGARRHLFWLPAVSRGYRLWARLLRMPPDRALANHTE